MHTQSVTQFHYQKEATRISSPVDELLLSISSSTPATSFTQEETKVHPQEGEPGWGELLATKSVLSQSTDSVLSHPS